MVTDRIPGFYRLPPLPLRFPCHPVYADISIALIVAVYFLGDRLMAIVRGFTPDGFGHELAARVCSIVNVKEERVTAMEAEIKPNKVESIMPTIAQQIEARGKAEGLLLQLNHKFGSVPEKRRTQIADAGQEELNAWLCKLLVAGNVDEVFEIES